jgi:hypothetical protein
MAKRKAKPPLSETYAARVARGRIPRSISLSAEASAILDELAERRGETRSATVEAAIVALGRDG